MDPLNYTKLATARGSALASGSPARRVVDGNEYWRLKLKGALTKDEAALVWGEYEEAWGLVYLDDELWRQAISDAKEIVRGVIETDDIREDVLGTIIRRLVEKVNAEKANSICLNSGGEAGS